MPFQNPSYTVKALPMQPFSPPPGIPGKQLFLHRDHCFVVKKWSIFLEYTERG